MEAKKVYESIIKLLFNVIRNDDLKYYLYNDKTYREKFVNLVNNLLTLEIDENVSYADHQWAKTFGQAIVIISKEKQRIQKNEKSVHEVYVDYTDFISLTSTEYKKSNLTDTKINFLPEDVLNDSKISEEKIEQIREKLEADKKAQEAPKTDVIAAAPVIKQNNNFQNKQTDIPNNMFGSQPQQLKVIENPLLNPRFYYYNKKQKWFPNIKKVFAVFLLITVVVLNALLILSLVSNIKFPEDAGIIGSWMFKPSRDGTPGKTLSAHTEVLPLSGGMQQTTFQGISFIILTLLLSVSVSYSLFRKPRNLNEKYHINLWPFLITIIIIVLSIVSFYPYINLDFVKDNWEKTFKRVIDESSFKMDDFNTWWAEIAETKNLDVFQGLSILSLVMVVILATMTLVIGVIQPKRDREKIARAVSEYQMAVGAMMQGQEYEIDPTLFDDDDEKIIVRKSKFRLWLDEKKSKKDKKK